MSPASARAGRRGGRVERGRLVEVDRRAAGQRHARAVVVAHLVAPSGSLALAVALLARPPALMSAWVRTYSRRSSWRRSRRARGSRRCAPWRCPRAGRRGSRRLRVTLPVLLIGEGVGHRVARVGAQLVGPRGRVERGRLVELDRRAAGQRPLAPSSSLTGSPACGSLALTVALLARLPASMSAWVRTYSRRSSWRGAWREARDGAASVAGSASGSTRSTAAEGHVAGVGDREAVGDRVARVGAAGRPDGRLSMAEAVLSRSIA